MLVQRNGDKTTTRIIRTARWEISLPKSSLDEPRICLSKPPFLEMLRSKIGDTTKPTSPHSYLWPKNGAQTLAYRLWRTIGSPMNIDGAGSQSIDAHSASQVIPLASTITGYRSGLWAPPYNVSSSAGAVSAWFFTVDGNTQVVVDAHTGKILAVTGNQ